MTEQIPTGLIDPTDQSAITSPIPAQAPGEGFVVSPFTEEWEGEHGASTHLVRVDVVADMEFDRKGNKSGFRRAVESLAEQSGVSLSYDERPDYNDGENTPVIITTNPQGVVEYFQATPGKKGRWTGLTTKKPGEYDAQATKPIGGDTVISFSKGETVFFGMVSEHAAEGAASPDSPSRELFRRVASAADTLRSRKTGSFLRFLRPRH